MSDGNYGSVVAIAIGMITTQSPNRTVGRRTRKLAIRRILCPIDFSPLTSASLASASAIARAHKAELRGLHVIPSEGAKRPSLGWLERQTLMVQLRDRLAEAAPAYAWLGAAVRKGDPSTEILRVARRMPADLIVMGAQGADRPLRPVGRVTSVVVSRSECPVLAVPSHYAKSSNQLGHFSRIVCAVDLSPSSLDVIHQALSLAWESHGRLTLVCVLPPSASERPSAARAHLLEAIPPEASDWCETEVVIARGTASSEIVRVAAESKADLVVIGAPRRWTSTTHAVLRMSLCPVLITHDARPLPPPKQNTRHAVVSSR